MLINKSTHLSKSEQIRLGSYYTPRKIVKRVYDIILPIAKAIKKDIIIFDNAAGCGAFISNSLDFDYRASDCDINAVNFLKSNLHKEKVFYANSLVQLSRQDYNIPEKSFLIQVGNPPYNDKTSEYKNGLKGTVECSPDIFDKDLGVSFLKSYNKLKADIICILHPLSYLIKPANFNRLREFRENYKLIKGIIFSSSIVSGTGSTEFPILIGLYQRTNESMNFEYISNFRFDILNNKKKFILADYETTDGFIHKYPSRKNESKISPINLYFYTFRDINSLKRNATFLDTPHYNSIIVTVESLYKYSYLYAFKACFKKKQLWIYGNLSPLVNKKKLQTDKKIYVIYALLNHPVLKKLNPKYIQEIKEYYSITDENIRENGEVNYLIQKKINQII